MQVNISKNFKMDILIQQLKIIQFQGEKRLPADGIVGPRTKEAILNEMKTLQEPESE